MAYFRGFTCYFQGPFFSTVQWDSVQGPGSRVPIFPDVPQGSPGAPAVGTKASRAGEGEGSQGRGIPRGPVEVGAPFFFLKPWVCLGVIKLPIFGGIKVDANILNNFEIIPL